MVIWKYEFEIENRFYLEFPGPAHVIHAALQAGRPCLWAMVFPDQPKATRVFRIFGTGHAIPMDGSRLLQYCATFEQGPFVWHLFEEAPPMDEEIPPLDE